MRGALDCGGAHPQFYFTADDPEYVIRALAQRLDQEDLPLSQVILFFVACDRHIDGDTPQLGIQFVQIGDDKEAAAFLKRLDDDLEGVRVSFST